MPDRSPTAHPSHRLGLWLVGAAGNIAATVAVGLAAGRRGLTPLDGLVTADPAFDALGLTPPERIVLGGHDIRPQTVAETAAALHAGSGVFGGDLLRRVRSDLTAFQRAIRPGASMTSGRTARGHRHADKTTSTGVPPSDRTALQTVDRLRADIRNFASRQRCDRVVVVNVASTEPLFALGPIHRDWRRLSAALTRLAAKPVLPASSLYALAAIEERCPYVNFTPSPGADVPALRERAAELGAPIMGSDGKTGETLLKSALAPMFRHRALRILSWDGHNILGNRDGFVLADPAVKAAKLRTKDGVIGPVLGYRPDTSVSIEYVPSLDDWKIAWDHIHFRGFLGVKMSLQFTWQGCDSILAAPLVIDLARLADFHAARVGGGVMTHLACFFKSPMDAAERGLPAQIDALQAYVAAQSRSPTPSRRPRGDRR